jgi:hypothetical protein
VLREAASGRSQQINSASCRRAKRRRHVWLTDPCQQGRPPGPFRSSYPLVGKYEGGAYCGKQEPDLFCLSHFCDFSDDRFRRRTPGPPPFSSMNSTPARVSTASIVASVVASPAYRPTSILVIVFRWRPVASARSRTVQFSAARAILTCALVTTWNLCYCHMCQCHSNH